MHNVLKSSTDWKQVEKKFKEENKLENKIKMNSIQIEKREWQRDKEEEEGNIHTQRVREKEQQQ